MLQSSHGVYFPLQYVQLRVSPMRTCVITTDGSDKTSHRARHFLRRNHLACPGIHTQPQTPM